MGAQKNNNVFQIGSFRGKWKIFIVSETHKFTIQEILKSTEECYNVKILPILLFFQHPHFLLKYLKGII